MGRAALSQLLIIGGLLLLVAIGFGIGMGNRVLSQVAGRDPVVPTPVPIPTPTAGDPSVGRTWKKTSAIAVATDPAFPDPRVTPEPEAAPTPKQTSTPKPTPSPAVKKQPEHRAYTSPPMPLPLVSHTPEGAQADPEPTRLPGPQPISRLQISAPVKTPAPSRAPPRAPTLPPVPVPSLNP